MAIRFETANASEIAVEDRFDLVVVLEALHDMSQPVEVLRTLRAALAPNGTLLVADEEVAEHFHAPAGVRVPSPSAFRARRRRRRRCAKRPREVFDELVELLPGSIGADRIMRGIGLVDFFLELTYS